MSLFFRISGRAQVRLAQAGAAFAAAAMIAGCGSAYRPVVTPINPSGPAAQPSALAVVVSSPSVSSPGVATVIDYAGDTVMAQADIGPGPLAFTIDETGGNGYTINSDGTLTNFQVSTTLRTDPTHVSYLTLPPTAQVTNLYAPTATLWTPDQDGNAIDVLTGVPQKYQLSIPVAPTPVAVAGTIVQSQRNYAISLNNTNTPAGSVMSMSDMTCNTNPAGATQTGEADSLETANYTVSARIPLGKCPVYAVESPDGQRLFVLNRGSDTITVINTQLNTLDQCTPYESQTGQLVTCHPTLPLSTAAVTATGITPPNGTTGMKATAGPVYAEYVAATQQLVVADYDGGTISVIDVGLDIYGNDGQTFGTTYTIPVGNNPASVTVLNDGSRAYTANQADGTVTIVNLSSHTVEKTLPVVGHPRSVTSTSNSLYGKVYVASPDSQYLTILRTDQDVVDTTILVQGNIVDVRTNNQSGTQGNAIVMSRVPGAGQPCNLPGTAAEASLATCQAIP
ncbi:MAG TPA: YncE family protein [Terracidiphilus sp.]|nr:YncE family protein [Terracidiphilus sp.]